jgi:hypothetical protein
VARRSVQEITTVAERSDSGPPRPNRERGTATSGMSLRMKHRSDWHSFNENVPEDYPTIDSHVQVRYANGGTSEGDFRKLLLHVRILHESPVTAWRYIKKEHVE